MKKHDPDRLRKLTAKCRQLGRFGFTRRECEIAVWLLEGKRDSEIGIILEIGCRTAEKHLENIRRKLDVETRTAAASCFRDLLDQL